MIHTSDLKAVDIPSKTKFWRRFALTFDPKELDSTSCTDIVWEISGLSALNLQELRYQLYCHQRRWNHFNTDPDQQTVLLVEAILNQMKDKVDAIR